MGIAQANPVDYIVISLYGLLMVLVGLYVMRFTREAAEYFRGGSRIPWLVAGLSCFMSGFSAWTFTGAAGVASGEACFTTAMTGYEDGPPTRVGVAVSDIFTGVYSAVGGRYARVFTAVSRGWTAKGDEPPSLEEIAAHTDEILNESGYLVPRSIIGEIEAAADTLRGDG